MSKKIPPPSLSDKGKTTTFHRFPHHIWHDQNLSLHERVVLCRVWSFLPRRCYLSYAQWAKELGCHRVTAVEILNKLVGKNKLTKSPAPEGSNEWHLVVSDYQLINEDDVASSPTLLPLVVTDYPPSSPTLPVLVVTDYPRRSLEDQLKDHKEDQIVADAPTPTYEYPLSLEEPQDAEVPQESDSVKEPIEISEAPPLPAAPPTAKKAKQPESGWSDVQAAATPEQWESIEMWRKHRTQMKKPCTPLSIMQNLKKYGSDLSAAIEHSIEKGWQGIFSPSQNGTHGKEPLTAGLTDKEIDLRLDFIWAHYKDSPIVPVRPFKDLAEENFVIDVLRSIFGDDYEEAIKKRRTDEKSFYQSAFRNKYKQGVENTKV